MKKNLLFLCFACALMLRAWGQEKSFVTTWSLDSNQTITIDLHEAFTYDFDYTWIRSNGLVITAGSHTSENGHFQTDFAEAEGDSVFLEITGTFPHFRSNDQLRDVMRWGDIAWESFEASFKGWQGESFSAQDTPDLRDVKSMSSMFENAIRFNQNLDEWDFGNAKDMSEMFKGATSFNQNLNEWNAFQVKDMSGMFQDATAFNNSLNLWSVDSVEDMSRMFEGAISFDQNLGNWNVSQVTDMSNMLDHTDLSVENYDKLLAGWSTREVRPHVTLGAEGLTYCDGLIGRNQLINEFGWVIIDNGLFPVCEFPNASFLTDWSAIAGQAVRIELHPDFTYDFHYTWRRGDGSIIAEGRYTSVGGGFFETAFTETDTVTLAIIGTFPHFRSNEQLQDVWQWGDITWQSFEASFENWHGASFSAQDSPDLSSVTNMSRMFKDASAFNTNIDNWNVSQVKDMSSMFEGASAFNQNLKNWDVSKVEYMGGMFERASAFNGDPSGDGISINNWNVGNVEDMSRMFKDAAAFNNFLNIWDVSQVKDMSEMFNGAAAFNKILSDWNVSQVTNMSGMFENAIAFDGDLSNWNVSQVLDMSNMLDHTHLSVENYDKLLIGWSGRDVRPHVTLGAEGLTYCDGIDGRSLLIEEAEWSITGDRISPACVFLTAWSASAGQAIRIPLHPDFNYDFHYTWRRGDGSIIAEGRHKSAGGGFFETAFAETDTVTLNILGTFPHFRSNEQLQDVRQWGGITWESFEASFENWPGASFSAQDSPDLSSVTDMSRMFEGAIAFNKNISDWNVSNVEDMSGMFKGAGSFNSFLNAWNVSNVKNMSSMFEGANSFNKNISSWDVMKVEDMSEMFKGATSFNQNLKDWNVSQVKNMSGMFESASAFNGAPANGPSINSWDVSNVEDMSRMFKDAIAFDYFLNAWDVSQVKDMSEMFSGATAFNRKLDEWNVSQVKNMSGMFEGASAFKGVPEEGIAINSWDVGNVEDMSRMFKDASAFNNFLNIWDVSQVEDMSEMFEGATAFNKNLNNWNVSQVKNMSEMFKGATNFNSEVFRSDLRKVEDMSSMFEGAESFDKNINHWDMENVKDMSSMFKGATSFDQDLNEWDVREVKFMNNMFEDAVAFNSRVNAWDTRKVTDMSSMFRGASDFNRDVNNWKVGKVEDMSNMFRSAKAFNKGVNAWDVSSVEDMGLMFAQATKFNQALNGWDVDNVKNMRSMFFEAERFNKELNGWDVRKVEDMSGMFSFTQAFNKPLNNWKIRRVEDMSDMFSWAVKFDRDLSDWDVTSVTHMARMFDNSDMGTGNYDDLLKGWSRQDVQPGVTLGARGLTYCQQADAREKLINDFGWTIVGDNECNSRSNTSLALAMQDTLKHAVREAHENLALSEANSGPVSDIEGLSIYPNPVEDLLHIESTAPVDVSLKDLQGKVWYTEKAAHTFELDITSLNTGVYLLILQYPDRTVARKIVKVSE